VVTTLLIFASLWNSNTYRKETFFPCIVVCLFHDMAEKPREVVRVQFPVVPSARSQTLSFRYCRQHHREP
jgi:hypothetical protein